MSRLLVGFLVCVCYLGQVAPAATISAVVNPNITVSSVTKPGQGFVNSTGTLFGTVANVGSGVGVVPNDNGIYDIIPNAVQNLATSTNGVIRTTARRNDVGSNVSFFTTTYAHFSITGVNTAGDLFSVTNSAYWEFTVNGIYNYSITDDTVHLGTRTFSFEKVGVGALGLTGTVSSGTYRLTYDHTNTDRNAVGPSGNVEGGTNLNIAFTYQSEDNQGGVVPEPSSVAVFGCLGLMSVVGKWRRGKASTK